MMQDQMDSFKICKYILRGLVGILDSVQVADTDKLNPITKYHPLYVTLDRIGVRILCCIVKVYKRTRVKNHAVFESPVPSNSVNPLDKISEMDSMDKLVCIRDFDQAASEIFDENSKVYFNSGADEEVTVQENREAFNRLLYN